MKKFGKFLFGTLSIATLAAGAYYVYKNFIKNDDLDGFDDLEDDFEDFDAEDDVEADETRDYVSIQIGSEEAPEDPQTNDTEVAEPSDGQEDTESESAEDKSTID